MLLKTEEVQAKHAQRDPAELSRWKTQQYLRAQIRKAEEFQRLQVTDPERQRGRTMFPHELEGYIKKLVGQDKAHFLVNPRDTSKKALYILMQDGNHWYLCSYENGMMPEYSIMEYKTEWVADPDATIEPHEVRTKGENAAMIDQQVPAREMVRGWRTVFVTLILKGLASPEAVERLVGGSERASWNKRTKGNAVSPI